VLPWVQAAVDVWEVLGVLCGAWLDVLASLVVICLFFDAMDVEKWEIWTKKQKLKNEVWDRKMKNLSEKDEKFEVKEDGYGGRVKDRWMEERKYRRRWIGSEKVRNLDKGEESEWNGVIWNEVWKKMMRIWMFNNGVLETESGR